MENVVYGFKPLQLPKRSVITIGTFDGVHEGHQALIAYTEEKAREEDALAGVFTFRTRACDVLYERPLPRLYPFEKNLWHIEKNNPDYVVAVDFSPEFGRMDCPLFFHKLIEYYRAIDIVVGEDFRFGHERVGDGDVLRRYARAAGIRATIFPFLKYQGEKVSTRRIRALLEEGRITEANAMLTRPFSLVGTVEKGKGLGKKIGYPTANIAPQEGVVLPKEGVYQTRVRSASERTPRPALTFIGKTGLKPGTFAIETHILDYTKDLYGNDIEVLFDAFLREIRPVSSENEVKALIANDIAIVTGGEAIVSRKNR